MAQTDPEYRSSNTRRALRRSARRLAEAVGGPLTLHDVSDDPAAIDRFIAMQASGWKGSTEHGGYAVALDPARERAFREKADAFRATGSLIVLELRAGPHPVYSQVDVVSADVALSVLDAYQDEYGRFSAGKLGRTAVISHLRQAPGLRAVNPGYYYDADDNDDEAANAFPDRREYSDVVIGVGVVPALTLRFRRRAERSKAAGMLFLALGKADRLALRIVDAAGRRMKPKSLTDA